MHAELAPPAKTKTFIDAKNPLLSARLFLELLRTSEGEDTLRYFAGDWWTWGGMAYRVAETEEIRRRIYRWAEEAWTRVRVGDEEREQPFSPTKPKIDLIVDALRAECFVLASMRMPSWLDGRNVDPRECIACQNAIIHLPTFAEGVRQYAESPTPLYFSAGALPFNFCADAAEPAAWLAFLDQIFEGDGESIALLQEWMGYVLTPDTRLQKMMLMYGPKRSGKGTAGRILTALLGAQNVASPTLSSLTTNFGLWPLIGKTLAIVGDARLSGRTDQSIITERLLTISGEDAVTIDRKNREPITMQLPTRIMLLTNELPRLSDASGALASRFLILRLKQSWYGREDLSLGDRLTAELPGILLWAIQGWMRLRAQGRFTIPATSEAAVQELDELSSPVTAFVRECCTVAAGHRVEVDTLYRQWVEWCAAQGREHPGTKQTFGRDIAAAYPALTVAQPRFAGVRIRMYEGIGLGVES